MDIWVHTVVSLILTIILWPIYGPFALLALVGGVLIDFDHIINYFEKTKSLSLKKTYNYCMEIRDRNDEEEYKDLVLIFHTYQSLAIMIMLAVIIPILTPCLFGMILHLILDDIHTYYHFKKNLFIYRMIKSPADFLMYRRRH